MTVIYTGEVYNDNGVVTYDVLCEQCKQVVGRLTRSECAYLSAKNERVLCFECDDLLADLIPSQLVPDEEWRVVVQEDERVVCIERGGRMRPFKISVAELR